MEKIVEISATILRELRKSLSIPEDVAAKKLGIKIELLRAWETEGTRVTVAKARKIAKVYKRWWTILLLDDVPKRKDLSKEYRSFREGALGYTTDTMLAFRNTERILYLAESINARTTDLEGINKLSIAKVKDIDLASNSVRAWLGIEIEDQLSHRNDYETLSWWIDKVESKGIFVSQINLPEEDKISGFTISDMKRSVIVINKRESVRRRIFSLLHELAHILTNSKESFDILETDYFSSNEEVEIYCNSIAGKVFIPKTIIDKYVIERGLENVGRLIEYLSNKFAASKLVVLRRFFDTGNIPKSTFLKMSDEYVRDYIKYHELQSQTKTEFVATKLTYPRAKAKENSFALVRDIFEAYRSNEISYHGVSSMLGVQPNHLPAIESLVSYV